jgi:hypothetical protein
MAYLGKGKGTGYNRGDTPVKICTSSRKKEWAFDTVIKRLADMLPQCNFIEERSGADIFLQMAPSSFFGNFAELQRTVCRLSGDRWTQKADPEYAKISKNLTECHTLVATNSTLEKLGRQINRNTILIPNGIDLEKWRWREPQANQYVCVGFSGNVSRKEYSEHKGFQLFRSVCNGINGVSTRVALYGDSQISPNRMLDDFYRQIDMLVLPTDGEGCSNTITEAIAAGVPVITTRKAGFHAELMKHGSHAMFAEKTFDSLLFCVRQLIEDCGLRRKLSVNARKFAEEHQDIKDISKKYLDAFNSCWRDNGGDVPRSKSADDKIFLKLEEITKKLDVLNLSLMKKPAAKRRIKNAS